MRSAASLAEARRLLAQAPPALVLLDVRLPDGSGLDLVQGLLDLRPEVRIVVLSGCPALLEPSLSLLPQLHAVLSKAEGLAPLRDALQALVQEFDPTSPDIASLSPRQLEMLLLIGEGLDTSEIAERLGISLATAQTHRRQITGRLGVKGTRLITLARSLALNRACPSAFHPQVAAAQPGRGRRISRSGDAGQTRLRLGGDRGDALVAGRARQWGRAAVWPCRGPCRGLRQSDRQRLRPCRALHG